MIQIDSQYRSTCGNYWSMTMTSEKRTASVGRCGNHIQVCVRNASNAVYRRGVGGGRLFPSFDAAVDAYKSGDVKSMIRHAEEVMEKSEIAPISS